MAWQLHITERGDGRWHCSHGRRHFDSHEDITEALDHLRAYAATLSGLAQVVVHRLDGTVEKLGAAVESLLEPDPEPSPRRDDDLMSPARLPPEAS